MAKKRKRSAKEERCIKAVKAKGGDVNPFAVCRASIAGTTKRSKRKKAKK